MDVVKTERFWTGSIQTRGHATMIIGRVAAVLGALAVLTALNLFNRPELSTGIPVFIFGGLALTLKRSPNLAIAITALAITTLMVVVAAGAGLSIISTEPGLGSITIVLALAWAALPIACYRAVQAVRALRKLPAPDPVPA